MAYDNGEQVFNVRSTDYNGGAVGDGVTNDAQAFKDALAAADAVGGTMFVPAGTYLIQLGDPATDPLWETISPGRYALLRVTTNGTRIQCDPGATVQVEASHIFQTATDTEPASISYLVFLGASAAAVTRVALEGGRWTWEAVAPAVLQESNPGFNSFFALGGYYMESVIRDCEFDGFPRGLAELGSLVVDGLRYSYNLYENVRAVNYGGAGGDNWMGCQGGTTIRGGVIQSKRTYQSHGIYYQLDRPGVVIDGVEFRDIRSGGKIPIAHHGTSGTRGYGPTVTNCRFVDCNSIENGSAPVGSAFKPYGGTAILGCTFDNSGYPDFGGITFTRTRGASVTGCTFIDSVVTIAPESEGVELDATCEFEGSAKVVLYGSAANNVIRGRFLNPEAIPISVTGTGRGNVVEGAQISIDLADAKYTTGGGAIAPPEAAIRVYPQGGTCDVRGGRISLQGHTAYSSIGIRTLAGTTSVSIHDVTFGSDSTTQGWAVIRVDGATVGPVRIAGCFEDRPLAGGVPVVLPAVNGPQMGGANITLLDNTFVGKLNGVTGVVRAERNLFGGVPDALDAGTVTTAQTPNAGPYREIRYTLGASITLNAPANPYRGAHLRFVLVQDATGGRAVTFNAVYKVNWTPDTTGGRRNVIEFVFDGTNWNQVSAATGL
ncbi:right-handed parallel beta-helix repeat-containing protein [Longimicrobium terrae]|uniref:Rhamnogalacturonase A/B/Epimerase-like pectate lyase domain-containing protein n=1 Tax=Longimicrobium terrae TaxID=1639882 RepID=A0A841H6Z4_9BACT|nr:right-handed parallel beta-helix repeat-containing protein [Longimicrobium terrae]MBB4638282.1 hypothetical protein [Longimicrobium terrae]MBB6073748.1 hypothetical protein [Longimicrobium terrae]NNC30242.1 right-handed parallel beta-helix repeat-containing protein [Longimicrobium terrae]